MPLSPGTSPSPSFPIPPMARLSLPPQQPVGLTILGCTDVKQGAWLGCGDPKLSQTRQQHHRSRGKAGGLPPASWHWCRWVAWPWHGHCWGGNRTYMLSQPQHPPWGGCVGRRTHGHSAVPGLGKLRGGGEGQVHPETGAGLYRLSAGALGRVVPATLGTCGCVGLGQGGLGGWQPPSMATVRHGS